MDKLDKNIVSLQWSHSTIGAGEFDKLSKGWLSKSLNEGCLSFSIDKIMWSPISA
jgi:hypothetical protein